MLRVCLSYSPNWVGQNGCQPLRHLYVLATYNLTVEGCTIGAITRICCSPRPRSSWTDVTPYELVRAKRRYNSRGPPALMPAPVDLLGYARKPEINHIDE